MWHFKEIGIGWWYEYWSPLVFPHIPIPIPGVSNSLLPRGKNLNKNSFLIISVIFTKKGQKVVGRGRLWSDSGRLWSDSGRTVGGSKGTCSYEY